MVSSRVRTVPRQRARAARRDVRRRTRSRPTRRAARPMRPHVVGVRNQLSDGRSQRVDVARLDDESGLAVDDRFVRSTAAARDRGHTAGRGFEEHDPESLGLEATPPVAARHREDVGARVERGQVGVGNPAEEMDARMAAGAPFETLAVAPRAADRDLHAVERGHRVDRRCRTPCGAPVATVRARAARRGRGRSGHASRRARPRAQAGTGRRRRRAPRSRPATVARRRGSPRAPDTNPRRQLRPRRAGRAARADG